MNDIKEKISALYDGELDHNEIDNLLKIIDKDPNLQEQLSLYGLAGLAVHQDENNIVSIDSGNRENKSIFSNLWFSNGLTAAASIILTLFIINNVDILQGTSANSLSFGSKNLRFSLDNSFQLKVKNKNQEIEKIDFLSYNLTFNYGGANNQKDRFSLIDSRVSFKKPNGQELLYLHMQHDMYDESNPDERNSFPELRKLTAQMSTHYRISGNKIGYNDFINDDINEQNSLDSLNSSSILFLDDKKPRIGSEELWRSDLNFSIQGDYNVEEKKWDFNYFNLDTRTTLFLTKKWLLTYAVGINLMDMEMRTQSLKLFRDLHCWEFMFTWWPTGISKGFQLNINIKHPDLKDVKVRSSSSNRTFLYN